ncbi:MAG: hypothetical protein JWM85_288 [Acidimicrobiaceae bacterium]|jgi:hypothetical protein|nr:hypothetical protein [Acidimicrobiaceae bacterium]
MLNPVVYMTSVQVEPEEDAGWNEFYDDWVRVFTTQVPGTVRGSRWAVEDGRLGGHEVLPGARPCYLAFEEYRRVDEFILSRSWRKESHWEPRVASFGPWFRHLSDYATLNLQSISSRIDAPDRGGDLATRVLCRLWTVDPVALEEFERWRAATVEPLVERSAPVLAAHRYVALLAQLHRHGGEQGELVIPQRHHFEEGGRLCYVDVYELGEGGIDPGLLDALQTATDEWSEVVADRQDVLAKRLLLVERDGTASASS